MKYFTIQEFTKSDKARELGINNNPPREIISNLEELGETLDLIRACWGHPIRVTSGYRSRALNKAVGGVYNSAHLYGYAADLQPVRGNQTEFNLFIRNLVISKEIPFDQLIIEKSGNTQWLHFGLYNSKHEQRRQTFQILK